jgi:hypothetical protein
MARVCLLDVNETLLDLGALDPLVERPDVVGADLREVAERILEIEAR